jgi:hypothetical protein
MAGTGFSEAEAGVAGRCILPGLRRRLTDLCRLD